MLQGHSFVRIHSAYMVNLDFIKSYTKGRGGFVTLVDNTVLNVSENRKQELLRQFEV
jgi:two-component system, LytTR family, response regulator